MQMQVFPGDKGPAGTVGEVDTYSQLPDHL